MHTMPSFEFPPGDESAYHVTPDEMDVLVADLQALDATDLRVDTFPQHSGRNVYALTLGRPDRVPEERRRLFVARPHAHEPAGTAACAEMAKAVLGYGNHADRNEEWRRWVLDHFVLTLIPDANPGGSQRAPVKFWDGSVIPNERFFLWMFGESGEIPGERFPRVDAWDIREVTPPSLLGIAYEQIDASTYVEPNRDTRSTYFRAFQKLDEIHHYAVWLDLHQTEYAKSDRNAHISLPACMDELPPVMQERHRSLGEAIHARWREEGAAPLDHPEAPYKNNHAQRNYLAKVWRPIAERMVHVVSEVQNNNVRTPVATQVRLEMAAVLETMSWMAAGEGS